MLDIVFEGGWYFKKFAAVLELADKQDLKSCGSNTVWVRSPPAAQFLEYGVWRNWLARSVWDAEVAGSSPVTPT